MLYYIDEKNNLLLHPDAVRLAPELSAVTEKELVFIIKAYDYKSKFRQFPEIERERRAVWDVFGDNVLPELKKKHSVKLAIEAYKGLQYNPKIELARRYQEKIDRLLDLLDQEDSPTQIEKITKAIDALRSNIMKLENEVDEDVQRQGVIRGNGTISMLETWQQNPKMYKASLMSRPVKEKEGL